SDPNLIQLTDPLGWGGATRQTGYFNDRKITDEIKQYRVEIEREVETPIVHAIRLGLNYTDNAKSLAPNE
ncbi:hypothetical protein NY536_17275, partial [Enterobacter hormaechei]|nr:hypothetical protein [Enterobacter hormaechei]